MSLHPGGMISLQPRQPLGPPWCPPRATQLSHGTFLQVGEGWKRSVSSSGLAGRGDRHLPLVTGVHCLSYKAATPCPNPYWLKVACRWPANTSVSECSSLNHGFTDYFWTILLDRSLGTNSQIFIILSCVNLIFISDCTIFSLYPGMELVDGFEKRQL